MVKLRRIEDMRTGDYRYGLDALQESADESYGHKMRRIRLQLGLSQAEVAYIVGVTPQTISNWERGLRSGVSPEAAQVARRVIELLSQRLRRKLARDRLDTADLDGSGGRNGVDMEPLAALPKRRVRRA